MSLFGAKNLETIRDTVSIITAKDKHVRLSFNKQQISFTSVTEYIFLLLEFFLRIHTFTECYQAHFRFWLLSMN